jgi:hypothetical protein
VVIMKLFMNHYEGSRCIPLCRIIPAHLTNCVNTREPRPLLYVNNRSVCLILELCSFGSLSDIIRGYGFDWNSSEAVLCGRHLPGPGLRAVSSFGLCASSVAVSSSHHLGTIDLAPSTCNAWVTHFLC